MASFDPLDTHQPDPPVPDKTFNPFTYPSLAAGVFDYGEWQLYLDAERREARHASRP